jgi:hypothetical protein
MGIETAYIGHIDASRRNRPSREPQYKNGVVNSTDPKDRFNALFAETPQILTSNNALLRRDEKKTQPSA